MGTKICLMSTLFESLPVETLGKRLSSKLIAFCKDRQQFPKEESNALHEVNIRVISHRIPVNYPTSVCIWAFCLDPCGGGLATVLPIPTSGNEHLCGSGSLSYVVTGADRIRRSIDCVAHGFPDPGPVDLPG